MIERLRQAAPLIGRVLISVIFLTSGIHKLTAWPETALRLEQQGLVAVQLLLIGAVLCELGGGLSILLGYWAPIGALVLLVYLVPTTLLFHDFWNDVDQQRQQQLIHFLKNLAIMGGLLFLCGFGSGCCSLNHRTPGQGIAPPL